MKVLSLDLDYIMGPSIDLYADYGWDDNAFTRWEYFYNEENNKKLNLNIDKKNLIFMYGVFLKSLKNSNCEVSFGYDHDNILYLLSNDKNIELVNIDHHHDIMYTEHSGNDDVDDMSLIMSYDEEYRRLVENCDIHEGNWVAKLNSENRLKSYTWIGNTNSFSELRKCETAYFSSLIPKFKMLKREKYNFENYNFDKIFVCLSPQYVPKEHWFYFKLFLTAYENFTGNEYDLKNQVNRKYETEIRHQCVTNEILY